MLEEGQASFSRVAFHCLNCCLCFCDPFFCSFSSVNKTEVQQTISSMMRHQCSSLQEVHYVHMDKQGVLWKSPAEFEKCSMWAALINEGCTDTLTLHYLVFESSLCQFQSHLVLSQLSHCSELKFSLNALVDDSRWHWFYQVALVTMLHQRCFWSRNAFIQCVILEKARCISCFVRQIY